ncbi:protein of unknown function [Taphrina deformans PYCC 5710]|uniref:Uncharacterized protein n=1 Tax=Taphrina deformans (strain PYCC 5710 / ATCC 11124 / CBS 356.35 / IMI 108563 / JCM 9778 / NBRC 8474) TaxID=1097556 RepID=R4XAE2_TAPDE|nr:protein of unknown function [Taphrina deformans PYCC 5710]|eukprot:CCG81239.1 protein of unknown function [Taphrina deformans PYCC 5710]
MSSRMGLLAAIGVGTFAVAYGFSQSSNTSKHASPANQSRPATNNSNGDPNDLSVKVGFRTFLSRTKDLADLFKGVERSGGGV